jgi:hypothetical protein
MACPYKPTVQERVALNHTKTRLEAILMIQAIVQARVDYWHNRVEQERAQLRYEIDNQVVLDVYKSAGQRHQEWMTMQQNEIDANERLEEVTNMVNWIQARDKK